MKKTFLTIKRVLNASRLQYKFSQIFNCNFNIFKTKGKTIEQEEKGVALKNLNKYNEAIECYNKAIQINPNYHLAIENKKIAIDCLKNNSK